ncbi:FAD-binding oxidoreductase [Motiliproteus sp. SC1-56]|uniref:NAD(P)/FAD-dependent oxidoreductase n=1 Tax=Motiliproteus sp. SC1-56 TaxID=2799565 RepID=UPI001A8D5DE8|nr:FAD-binding oxidoreductase [Motiliproteus sp. SC1-56]
MDPNTLTHSSLPDSLWASSACPAPPTRPLEGATRADVAIIGGGFTGLSAALHLAEKGLKVSVLEACEIGYGGSGRNVGLVNAGLWMNPDDIDAQLGKEYGDRLDRILGGSPELVFSLIERFDIPCEATRNGTLHLAHSKSGLKGLTDRARQLQARGAPVQLLDAATTAAMTGTERYHGAILDPRAGTIQPLGYVRGLASAAKSLGASIYTRSPVTRLAPARDGQGWSISTPDGSLQAEKVILATNAYGSGAYRELQQTFTPLHFFQFATAPLPDAVLERILPGKQGCWDTRQVMTSIRLDQAGRLILGSIGQLPDNGSRFLQGWAADRVKSLFPELYPQIKPRGETGFWHHGWVGTIAFSPDHLPHLHQLGPNLISCVGYSGRGIGPGTIMGKAMADYVTGSPAEDLPLPLTEPKQVVGRSIREQYYARGSDLYHAYQRVT